MKLYCKFMGLLSTVQTIRPHYDNINIKNNSSLANAGMDII